MNITLARAIERGDERIGAVTLRKPDTGSLRGIALTDILRMDVDSLADLVPRLSQITKEEFLRLDPYDVTMIAKEVIGFLTTPPAKSQAETAT